jgi:hypothetical protein
LLWAEAKTSFSTVDLLGKAGTTAVVFGVDVIDKPTVFKHEFLVNLGSAAKAFVCILINSIFSVALLNSGGKVWVYLNHCGIISANFTRKVETFLYIFEFVFIRGSCDSSLHISEARQSVRNDVQGLRTMMDVETELRKIERPQREED